MNIDKLTETAKKEVVRSRRVLWADAENHVMSERHKGAHTGQRGAVVAATMRAFVEALAKQGEKCVEQLDWLYENAVLPFKVDDAGWEDYTKHELKYFQTECIAAMRELCDVMGLAAVDTFVGELSGEMDKVSDDTLLLLERKRSALQNARMRSKLGTAQKLGWIVVGAVPSFILAWLLKP